MGCSCSHKAEYTTMKKNYASNAITRDGSMPRLKTEWCPICREYVLDSHSHSNLKYKQDAIIVLRKAIFEVQTSPLPLYQCQVAFGILVNASAYLAGVPLRSDFGRYSRRYFGEKYEQL